MTSVPESAAACNSAGNRLRRPSPHPKWLETAEVERHQRAAQWDGIRLNILKKKKPAFGGETGKKHSPVGALSVLVGFVKTYKAVAVEQPQLSIIVWIARDPCQLVRIYFDVVIATEHMSPIYLPPFN